ARGSVSAPRSARSPRSRWRRRPTRTGAAATRPAGALRPRAPPPSAGCARRAAETGGAPGPPPRPPSPALAAPAAAPPTARRRRRGRQAGGGVGHPPQLGRAVVAPPHMVLEAGALRLVVDRVDGVGAGKSVQVDAQGPHYVTPMQSRSLISPSRILVLIVPSV